MPETDAMLPALRRVLRRRRETADTWTLAVEAAADGTPFGPGQFNMLYAFGVGEIAVSLAGDPADERTHLHTVRTVGAVSRAIAALRPGATLGVRGPFGAGWPLAACRGQDVVLVAGGLGLAPLRPALHALLARRADYGRITLLVGARGAAAMPYRGELARLARRRDLDVQVTVDHADAAWTGHVGVVTALVRRLGISGHRTRALVCGPEVMMRFAAAALGEAGVADHHIHLSLERNMHCAVGLCGRCQFGPHFTCRDGPVFSHDRIAALLAVPEV